MIKKDLDEIIKEMNRINKSLTKLKNLLSKANYQEKQQIWKLMEYLERDYKTLQIKIWNDERDRDL
jgi:uncharacterized protein YpuA (DUF1002 family)